MKGRPSLSSSGCDESVGDGRMLETVEGRVGVVMVRTVWGRIGSMVLWDQVRIVKIWEL